MVRLQAAGGDRLPVLLRAAGGDRLLRRAAAGGRLKGRLKGRGRWLGPPPGPPGGAQGPTRLPSPRWCAGSSSLPSFLCCSLFGTPLSLAAIIAGIIALGNIGKKPELEGKGMAIAGIVTGAVSILLLIVALAFGVAGALLNKKL